ncbi:putative reverse transcriptase domain-containing protein [Tanacetum coccineum]|uniref:Reverse transcriptase domain-containing protein n=1 Tax=Tanacetum coccineum TaxID=301880 RepID=A0ABQ5IRT8_9ASTR
MQKIQKYEWVKEQKEAFQMLKDNLCNTSILSLPDGSKDFVVYCDASNQGLGCVLMQRDNVENATAEMLCGLDQLMERKECGGMYLLWVLLIGDVRTLMIDEAHASRYLIHSGADKTYYDLRDMYGGHVWRRILLPMLPRSSSGYDTNWVIVDRLTKAWSACVEHLRSWWKIYFAALVDIAEGIENTAKTCDAHLPLTEFSIIIVIIRVFDVLYLKRCIEGSVGHMFFRLKLEKFSRLDQNWYKRQQIRIKVGDKVMLEVSPWKEVVHFGKKGKLAPRYAGPFEILEMIGPVAYRLRLPKELSEVHDIFHMSNLKKCLADANLHVLLEEIKVDKTLHFVEEPVEMIDREVKSLKHSRIPIVKSIRTRSEIIRIS